MICTPSMLSLGFSNHTVKHKAGAMWVQLSYSVELQCQTQDWNWLFRQTGQSWRGWEGGREGDRQDDWEDWKEPRQGHGRVKANVAAYICPRNAQFGTSFSIISQSMLFIKCWQTRTSHWLWTVMVLIKGNERGRSSVFNKTDIKVNGIKIIQQWKMAIQTQMLAT